MGSTRHAVLGALLAGTLAIPGSPVAATDGASAAPTATPAAAVAARAAEPDFNADGFADLAIGVPYERTNSIRSGGVHVLYGSAGGLQAADDQLWTQDTPGIPDTGEAGDAFGWSLATGDFDGDGYTDLAVGTRREDLSASRLIRNAGAVTVIRGSALGLTATGARQWHAALPGMPLRAGRGDQYGWSLVAGDLDGDGRDDLVVGIHFKDLPCGTERCANGGAIQVLYGTVTGLELARTQVWTQASPGIPEEVGSNDRFGWSMAIADFDGDGFGDLAVGAPYERYLTHRDGIVHIIRGSRDGLTARGTQVWSQGSPGILDEPYLREQFGQSLAAGDLDGDGFGDLVAGVWFQDHCWICNEGVVHALYGSRHGLTAAGNQQWHQDSPGILDSRDPGDQFGQALAIDDVDGDGIDDLVVGTPWEDFTHFISEDQGAINVLYGTHTGLRAARNQRWRQGAGGIVDRAERNDHFAEAIGTGDFNGDGAADLAVGIAWETLAGVRSGAVAVIDGSPDGLHAVGNQLWTQDSMGVEDVAEHGDRFGWSLSSANARAGSPRICYGNRGGPC